MSLIHEALKKAEQQRRLGEPPSLGTPFGRAPRRRSMLPYLAVAIVGVLGAGWYLSQRPVSDEPADVPTTAATAKTAAPADPATLAKTPPAAPGDSAASSSAAERRPTMGPNAVANQHVVPNLASAQRLNNQAPPATPPTPQDIAERESEPRPPGANPLAPGEAAPLTLGAAAPDAPLNDAEGLAAKQVAKEREFAANADAAPARSPFFKERAAVPATGATKPAAPTANARSGAGAPTAAAPIASTPAVRPTDVAKAPVAAIEPPAAAGMPVAGAPPPAIAAVAATPPPDQLPIYWQLPYNVRKELPEIKLSMHVYSATPAQRFVVLNGNRQVEGDELGGDVHVAEIRSDGVVLTYQGQRFLVPRGGS